MDTPGETAHELLARGEVDAILTWEPYAKQALAAVKGTRLFDTSQIAGLSWSMYAARPGFLAQRGLAQTQLDTAALFDPRFLRALQQA